MTGINKIEIGKGEKVVIVTGAGISAESGIKTFRDLGGLWEEYNIYEVASPEGWKKNPFVVWKFYSERRRQALQCKPNPAHFAITNFEKRIGEDRFLLITQNVDSLHIKAGTKKVIEIHGSLFRSKCGNELCIGGKNPFYDENFYFENIPSCKYCGSFIRPDVVWFGEFLDPMLDSIARKAISQCTIFIAIGTSGVVFPVAHYPLIAKANGARTILINKDLPENLYMFDEFHQGNAGEIVPELL